MAIQMTDENSWRCAVHPDLKCRIYPRTSEALRQHYEQAADRANDPHLPVDGPCQVCRVHHPKGGKGRQRDPNAMRHKTGIQYPRKAKYN